MKTVHKKKLYNGKVELRDYEVDRLVKHKLSVRVFVGDEYMDLTPSQLKRGIVVNTQHSIYNEGQTYKLIGYEWKGKKYKEEDTTIPVNVKLRLKEIWEQSQNGTKRG